MKAQKLFALMKERGVKVRIESESHMVFTGDESYVKYFEDYLSSHKELREEILREISDIQAEAQELSAMNLTEFRRESEHGLSLQEFLTDSESAGVRVELHELYTLTFTGGKNSSRKRLAGILERNSYLKAALILSLAAKNQNFLDVIQECACNRWCDGYSDSLLMAVLCNLTHTGETVQRDANGNIILKTKTDWEKEIASL